MRVHELILSRAGSPEGTPARLLVHASAESFVTNPILTEHLTVLPLDGEKPAPGDIVLTLIADPDELSSALDDLPPDVYAAIALTVPIEDLPVGSIIDTVLSAGAQVRELVPVQSREATCVLLVMRSDELVVPAPYLRPQTAPDTLDQSALHRLLAEQVIDGVVSRARQSVGVARAEAADNEIASLRSQLEAAQAERVRTVAALNTELEAAKRRADAVESSAAQQLGRALLSMRHHPLRGTAQLTREVRGVVRDKRARRG
jgi:cell division protein ZapA (FtsZ GTPase activity inhibitor)